MDTIKKVQIRPDENNYETILHPETSLEMVVNTSTGEKLDQTITSMITNNNSTDTKITNHIVNGNNPHCTTKAQVGLWNVTTDKQMPFTGGTFTGIAKAQNNTSYTTAQLRNITISTANPTGGNNGDLWFKYVWGVNYGYIKFYYWWNNF